MPVTAEDLVIYLSVLSEEMNLLVLVPQNIKGGLITGTSATLGGLCGGPAGLLFGGAIGCTISAVSFKPKTEEAKDLLVNLSRKDRVSIYDEFATLLEKELRCRNYTEFSACVERNVDLKHDVLKHFKSYILNKWKLKLYDPRVKDNDNEFQ